MSGAWIVSVTLAEPERARLRELDRQAQVRRRWRLVQAQREELAGWARSVARQYRQVAVDVAPLPELSSPAQPAADRAFAAAEAETARLRRQVAAQVNTGRDEWVRAVVPGIGPAAGSGTAPARTAVAAGGQMGAAGTAAPDPAERLSRLVRRLDPDLDLPSPVRQLVTGFGAAPAARRAVLLASLREQVQTLNKQSRRRREIAAGLAEVALVVHDTGDQVLRVALEQARSAATADRPIDLTGLRTEARAAEQRQQGRRARELVRDSLVTVLTGLDYQPVPANQVQTSDPAMLLRHPASPRYAARVAVRPEGIRFESVRLVSPDRPAEPAEPGGDLAAGRQLSAQMPLVLAALPPEQVRIGPVRTLSAPGARPAPRVLARVEPVGAGMVAGNRAGHHHPLS